MGFWLLRRCTAALEAPSESAYRDRTIDAKASQLTAVALLPPIFLLGALGVLASEAGDPAVEVACIAEKAGGECRRWRLTLYDFEAAGQIEVTREDVVARYPAKGSMGAVILWKLAGERLCREP